MNTLAITHSTSLGVCSYLRVTVRLLISELHCLVMDWGGEGPPIEQGDTCSLVCSGVFHLWLSSFFREESIDLCFEEFSLAIAIL